jgi:uncharacterized membrane protein
MTKRDLHGILRDEKIHLQKLHELVNASLNEEQLLSTRLLELESEESLTLGQRMADHLASFGGSWVFIFLSFLFIASWMLLARPIDPYPFIFLNLVLSCIAALQAPIIMMSQNRQEEKDRQRARSDYMINIKAEMEVRHLHEKIDLLIAEQMHSLFELQRKQLDLLERIEKKL